jgi:MAGUK p55 subfamily protein 5
MHKITKGLKKKKNKNKKHKKEDELFDEVELEKYRREHQQDSEVGQQEEQEDQAAGSSDNEEWRRFKALTAGVDSVLKKTQGDLDRIKSSSYFQR